MKSSQESGKPIDSDAEVEVTMTRPGARWTMRVREDEAADWQARGTAATGWRGWQTRFGPTVKTFAKWAAALVVASLVIPAATKQWSDRQSALALKSTLISDVSTSAVRAYDGSRLLVNEELAEQSGADTRAQAAKKARERKEATRNAWNEAVGGIDARYQTYFPGSDAAAAWRAYRDAINKWIALGCCDGQRRQDIASLKNVLHFSGKPPITWDDLECVPHSGCEPVSPGFAKAYVQ